MVIETCHYDSISARGVSCIASTYCGVTRKHLDFRNRHIETHQFTLLAFFPQRNDMFEKLRAQGKYTANLQAAEQLDVQISGRSVQLSRAVQPRHRLNKQRDLFFGFSAFKIGGGGMHHPKWCHTQGVRPAFLEKRLLVQQTGGFRTPPPPCPTLIYYYTLGPWDPLPLNLASKSQANKQQATTSTSPFRFGHCSASSLRALLYSRHPRA